jgi:hypothetical protein
MSDLIASFVRARRKTIKQCEKKLKVGNLTDLQRKHVQWRLAEELYALDDLLQEVQMQIADDQTGPRLH